MQPESLLLGETLSLVVPKQSTLDLSHAQRDGGEQGVQTVAGVYAAPCAGDTRQVHLHGNKKTGENSFDLSKEKRVLFFPFVDSV